jgi:predicted ATP-grasp superfamily ATP-dependent carboligase
MCPAALIRSRSTATGPLACVIGDMDLVRALGVAGIGCAVVARRWEGPWFSRHTRARIPWVSPSRSPEELVHALLEFGRRQDEPPVLYYQADPDMLVISRHRDTLASAFRFVIPGRELVETLADKARFATLARQLELPVPRSCIVPPGDTDGLAARTLREPLIVKPAVHVERRDPRMAAKAVTVADRTALRRLLRQVGGAGPPMLVQEAVAGPESHIESHHAFVDGAGEVVADFTGRKIRTVPAENGYSSAVEITAEADVRDLGRECLRRLGLRGVAKLDFKRDPEGRLWLLEVNPRFNLWHLPGALAGVNLPALVFDELTGRPRRSTAPVRVGTTWCELRLDFKARREAGIPWWRWAAWALRTDAKRQVALDDPLPFVAGVVGRRILERGISVRDRRWAAAP